MPLPETLPDALAATPADVCAFADRWGVEPALMLRAIQAAGDVPFDVWIFSGARSATEQSRLSPTPFSVSTHADHDAQGCPRLATGIDMQPVSPGVRLSSAAVAQLGAAAVFRGLRWGGGAPVGDDGIPVGVERWHFDLGPRAPP